MSFNRSWYGRFLAALILLAAFMTACGPSLTPQAPVTPVVFTIQHTPALNALRSDMTACMNDRAGAGLVVEERSGAALILGESDASLRWDVQGELPTFSAVIGQEELVIITHPDNPSSAILLADLQSIYTGGMREWPEPGTLVSPYAYPAGDDVQLVFEAIILGGTVVPSRITYTAPDPAAVIEAIAGDPSALGYIPRRWLNSQVKELTVEGIELERLTRPLVALAESEPSGPARDWLLCLQDELK